MRKWKKFIILQKKMYISLVSLSVFHILFWQLQTDFSNCRHKISMNLRNKDTNMITNDIGESS